MTPEQVLSLAELLSQKIRDRRGDIATNVSYFKGTEGRMKFASDEFRDYFRKRFEGFSDNWCAPVAQAPIERIHYLGMRLGDKTSADPDVARRWERSNADRGLAEAALMMTVAKRSFGLVSPTPKGARITFEHPDSAAVIYDAITRERRAGMVIWQDEKWEYGQLHLPESVLNVRRQKSLISSGEHHVPPDAQGWEFNTDANAIESRNPLGAVSLVEFRNQSMLDDDPISDIAGVRAMQDSINLIWAYLLNALDYTSLPGRAILGGEKIMVPILDDKGQKTGERPLELDALIRDRMVHIPGGKDGKNPTIDEWTAADPSPLSAVIEQAIGHVAAQTRTPGHYLLTKSNVGEVAYELSEAGLVSKTSERISFMTAEVREINRLAALAEGKRDQAAQIEVGKTLWKKPQYRSEEQLMDGLQKMRAAGFPFQWIAEEYGLSPEDVKRVLQMRREEQAEGAAVDLSFLNKPVPDGAAAVPAGD